MEIAIRVEGKSPLLLHRFTDAAQMAATNGTRSNITTAREPREEAESHLYVGEDGTLIVPSPNMFRCIIDAGKFHKVGKSKMTTVKSSLIPAALLIDPADGIPILHDKPWTVDTRPIRIPANGSRILRHRPCFHDWALEFTLTLDTDIISHNTLRDVVDDAGNKIGLGDFRPDTKGPFGRFVVTNWIPSQR